MESDFYRTRVFNKDKYHQVISLTWGAILAHDDCSVLLINQKTRGSMEYAYMGLIHCMVVSPDHAMMAVYTEETMPGETGTRYWVHRMILPHLDPDPTLGIPPFLPSTCLSSSVMALSIDNKGKLSIETGEGPIDYPVEGWQGLRVYRHRESA